jgi:phospholipid/cholesterol/gamma-HCH transport system substrate-binding protein
MSNGNSQEAGLSPESKVGLFVLAGFAVLMISILMLGDIHFRPQDHYFATFNSIEGISNKSPVKIFGVEVGSVKEIELESGKAQIKIALKKGIPVYKNATVRIRSTGIIGSKFIALDPGKPDAGISEEEQRLKSGDTLNGQESLSIDELMERVAKSLDDITGGGRLGSNLNATMENLRHITDSLNAALGQQQKTLVTIVRNVEDFSTHAKSVAAHLDDILSSKKEEVKLAITNLKETFEKSNDILAGLKKGEGTLGVLLNDKKSGEEIKETITNLKKTSESAKEVLARFTKVRAFWIVQGRWDTKSGASKGDVGMRLEPRDNKFYEIMGQNLSTTGSTRTEEDDYERTNTITGMIGNHWGPFTAAIGVFKSRAGLEARYRPFQMTEVPVMNRLEFVGQGSDFGRDAIIKGRRFDSPNYMAGARLKVNKWVTAGVQSEDIAETSNVHGLLNVTFEDKDIAYLLGFVSFAR